MNLSFYTDLEEWGFSLLISIFNQKNKRKRNFELWINFLCFSVCFTFLTIKLHDPNEKIEWPRE